MRHQELIISWALPVILALSTPVSVLAQSPPTTNCVTSAVAGGTGDALTIPTLPCVPTTTLLILTAKNANTTTTPTLTYPGGKPMPIQAFSGSALPLNALSANARYLLTSNGVNWFVLSQVGGALSGLSPSVVGDPAIWANTTGSLLGEGPALRLNIPNGAQTISQLPLGNPVATLSTLNVQGTTQAVAEREYLTQYGFVSTQGINQGNSGQGDKATIYASIEAAANSGNVWAFNPLVQVDAGRPAGGHDQVVEWDLNNNAANVSAVAGPAGMGFPASSNTGPLYQYGGIMECSGSKTCSAAYVAAGANFWLRGFNCFNSISVSCFSDYTNSAIAIDIWGSHINLMDVSNATVSGAILVKNNVFEISNTGYYEQFSTALAGDEILQIGGSDNNGTISLGSAGTIKSPHVDFHSTGNPIPDFQLSAASSTLSIKGTGSNTEMTLGSGAPATLGTTTMQLLVNNNGGVSLVPVTLGAVNSCGTGFRCLAVPN